MCSASIVRMGVSEDDELAMRLKCCEPERDCKSAIQEAAVESESYSCRGKVMHNGMSDL